MTDLSAFLSDSKARVDATLTHTLDNYTSPLLSSTQQTTANSIGYTRLFDAMKYSVFNGGKRIRPALLFACAKTLQPNNKLQNDVSLLAAAVECIHAYSLIHDDLPAMDDDDLRRGKPTCHIAFDEATAILAGDALQTLAFTTITNTEFSAEQQVACIKALSHATGAFGMTSGQMMDLHSTNQTISADALKTIHQLKTGALIRASAQLAAIACHADQTKTKALDDYTTALGLAFQIQDDILDAEGDTQTLGKTAGADASLNKSTYPTLLGMDEAKRQANLAYEQAIDALSCFDDTALLRDLASFIVKRNH